MSDSKLSADLRISKKFKYTPIFKTSFIKAKDKPPKNLCAFCNGKVGRTIGYVLLAVLLIFSCAVTIVLWTTNTYQQIVLENLPYKNNTKSFEFWKNPPAQPKVQIYIFNYTNVPAFLKNGEKLKVEEIGPYTYREKLEKVNVVWNNNATITFQEKRSYKFIPELSNGWETDRVVIPNIPLLAAVATVRNEYYLVRLSLDTILRSMDTKPFVHVNVKELLWGYEDPLFTMARSVISLKHKIPGRKFGIMQHKVGVSPWRVTVNTGELDLAQLGIITHYNGEDSLDYWNSESCNRINGSESGVFPPFAVQEFSRLHIYNRDLCRRFPLVFKEHSKVFDGIPALRFHPPRDVFLHPSENPENSCYCDPKTSVCPPSGVFNVSPCVFDAPVFISFPHFYLGDPVLLETVDGLKPDPSKHEMFIDVHPKLGAALSGNTAMQVNTMVLKATGIHHLNAFKDRDILPILWINVVLDELDPEVRYTLYHVTYSVRALQLLLMYGLPVLAAVCATALLHGLRRACKPENSCAPASVTAVTATVFTLSSDDILAAA